MYCVKCGKKGDEDARFCIYCGQRLSSEGKVVFENMYTGIFTGRHSSGYMSVYCYIDKKFVNELFTKGRENSLKNARFIHDVPYGKHTIYLLIHNNLVEKEIELTPENPVVYVYMKRKGGTNIKDVRIEYCREVKPYINNVSASSINVSSLKPKFEIPDSLFYGVPIIAVQVVSLLLLLMGSTDEFIGIIINLIAIAMAIVNMVRAAKELNVAKKLEIDNYDKFHSAIRITNFLYIMSILVGIGLLVAFILILIK